MGMPKMVSNESFSKNGLGSCEESESLLVRNPPKTVGPGVRLKKRLHSLTSRPLHWYRDTSAKAKK